MNYLDLEFDNDNETDSDFIIDKSFNVKGEVATDKADEDFVPTHNIIIDFCLKGEKNKEKINIYGRIFYVANLKGLVPVINHNIGTMLPKMDDDYDEFFDEEENDLESQASTIAYLDDLQIRKIDSGYSVWKLNDNSVLHIVKDEDYLMFNFSDLFNKINLPDNLRKFVPDGEIMLNNLLLEIDNLNDVLEFEWIEKDKGIKISVWLKVEEI